ncbi:MAG TPA: hypothetical protein VI854_07375 [Acidimicrobiia bacterium]|nr:hypothetical protein [Acidimicrobiia bacterium]
MPAHPAAPSPGGVAAEVRDLTKRFDDLEAVSGVSFDDRLAIIDHGRIVALDTSSKLKAQVGGDTVELATADDGAALRALQAAGFTAEPSAEGLTVFVSDGESAVAPLIGAVGVSVHLVRVHRPTLDDVFLHFPAGSSATPRGHDVRHAAGLGRPPAVGSLAVATIWR